MAGKRTPGEALPLPRRGGGGRARRPTRPDVSMAMAWGPAGGCRGGGGGETAERARPRGGRHRRVGRAAARRSAADMTLV